MRSRRRSSIRRILTSPTYWLGVGFMITVGFMLANAVLYFDHPRGRGLNLFATIWIGIMALWQLYNLGRIR